MTANRCLILRNAAGVTELIPLDKVVHAEYTESKANVPHDYEDRIVLAQGKSPVAGLDRLRDAALGPADAVRRLGDHGSVLVPADWVLVW
jgi:hypothetical protein